ncbi:MAG TPA: hypothetical protein VGY58_15380 [Gemmataceae bacterium]|nr:hypothetical protein [Gemmataceae bacterium]
MLRAWCVVIGILVFPRGPAFADVGGDPGANAALKYWQAFATLPAFTAAEQQKLSLQHLSDPVDAQARALASKGAYALRMLHLGAALPRCDWGIPYEQGIAIYVPHSQAARTLCALACLRARLRFEDGKNTEAIDDIVAAMKLGRQVSRDGINLTLLVGYALEHHALETLALYLPRLNADQIKDVKARLGALPPGGSPAAALRKEEGWALDWFIRQVKEARDRDSLVALLGQCSDADEKNRDAAQRGRALLEECGGSADGVVKFAEESRQSYELMEKKLGLPLDQFEKEWDRELMKRSGNPVFRMIYPAIYKVRLAQARIDVRRALLAAAFDVQLDGRDALKNHADPVVGTPFEYAPFEGGFQLRSPWKVNDESRTKWQLDERLANPIALTVGVRGK